MEAFCSWTKIESGQLNSEQIIKKSIAWLFFFKIIMYYVLQCKQTETIQQFGDKHAESDNCVRLSLEFYIDPTLVTLFWTNRGSSFIWLTSLQHTTTGLPTYWAG